MAVTAIRIAQLGRRRRGVGHGHDTPHRHRPSPRRQGVRDVGHVGVGVPLEEGRESFDRIVDGLAPEAGDEEWLATPAGGDLPARRRLLDDDVRVRAAHPERADAGTSGRSVDHPGCGGRRQDERRPIEVEERARSGVVGERRQGCVSQGLNGLDQARSAGGRVEVADVRLRRREATKAGPVGRTSKSGGECGDLDRVPDRCSGAVCLEQADRVNVDRRHGQRLAHHVGVPVDTRCEEADLALAVVVDRRPLDDREHGVAIVDCVREAAQRDHRDATGQHRPVRLGIERPAASRR
ncbi:MAG: hypothetical protein R2697_11120 [Ilumatobacteraceae bacterium]